MTNPVSVAARRLGQIGAPARVREFAEIVGKTVAYDRDKGRRYRAPLDAPAEYRAYAQALRNDGYVLIPQYRSAEWCKDMAQRLLDAIPEPPAPGGDEGEDYRVYEGSRKAVLDGGGVVEWRNMDGADAKDQGIICFYHVDEAFPELVELRQDPLVSSVIAAANGRPLPSRAYKAFVNASAGATSDYHVDQTAEDQFKTFLFLTDVNETVDGAHSYVPGTHLPSLRRYVNYAHNFVDPSRYEFAMGRHGRHQPVDLLTPAGTLAIVDITGHHRALPQAPGRMRIVLNNCFDGFTYD
jgi:hypothetical protein